MRILLFDIDGTLVNTAGAGQLAMAAALAAAFGAAPHAAGVVFSGRTDRAIARDLFRLHGVDDTRANWECFQEAYLEQLSAYLPRRKGRVLPGVRELLDVLSLDRDASLGLLTGNVPGGAEQKLRHYGLNHHFARGGFGDVHMERDQVAHEALQATRRHVGAEVAVEQIWVIGDTPRDVQCARAIGARVLAVATGIHEVDELRATQPDELLNDLSDTVRVLDLLNHVA